jgi:RNA polymerase sigma factor (TIGR02999 family)
MPDDLPGSRFRVTNLLRRWGRGDREALDQLMPLVYQELHRMASRYMTGERAGHTLQSTALVHEAYVRLVDQRLADWQNRAQFFGLAAQAMRRILVDHARSRGRAKRGSGEPRAAMDAIDAVAAPDSVDVEDAVAIDVALNKLQAIDPGQAEIVELRFFGGLTVEETAEVLSLSPRTVKREWALARAWLHRELAGAGPRGNG